MKNISKRRIEKILSEVYSAIPKWYEYAEQALLEERVVEEIRRQHIVIYSYIVY